MSILASHTTTNSILGRFGTPPWHDRHPAKLDLEQRLAPDHLARTLDQAVDRLDLTALRARYGGTGSPAHPPERLLRVVLYELRRGQHSPAAWHRDARECEPVRWLLRGAVVARSCWYTFRDRVGPLLLDLQRQVLLLALAAGVTTATRGAEDGTLVAANASRHKLVNQATLQHRAEVVAAAVAADQQAADTLVRGEAAQVTAAVAGSWVTASRGTGDGFGTAAAVPTPAGAGMALATAVTEPPPLATAAAEPPPLATAALRASPRWLASSVAGRLQQQQRLERAQQRMEELQGLNKKKWASKRRAADAIVLSLGDPEAVVARDKEKVYRPLYNVQIIDDLDSPLILAYGVFAQQNDTGVLGLLVAQVRQQLARGLQVLLADTAYAGGADLAAAAQQGVTVYAPVPGDGVKQPKQIPKREFSWQAAERTYVCPQGHRLVFEETWREKRVGGGVQVWRYRCPPEHCLGCPLQARCTQTPAAGRAVTRQEHEELLEALRARMATPEAQALYRLRGQNVELVNADWKHHRKLRRFSGRGLARAECAVGLMVLAHNLVALQTEEKKLRAKNATAAAVNPGPNST